MRQTAFHVMFWPRVKKTRKLNIEAGSAPKPSYRLGAVQKSKVSTFKNKNKKGKKSNCRMVVQDKLDYI